MKGIVAKPMPKHWYDEKAAEETGDIVNEAICASKKPYFMIYRYPELRSRYAAFQKLVERKHKMTYRCHMDDNADPAFIEWYQRFCPVHYGRGVVNRICETCENYFANYSWRDNAEPFDPNILKTGVDYSRYSKDQIARLYSEYMERLQTLTIMVTPEELNLQKQFLQQWFLTQCAVIVPSEIELCDIVIDLTYDKEKSKQFAWDMCGDQIVANVLRNTGGTINWPRAANKGNIVFGGKCFKMETLVVNEVDNNERYHFE